MRGLVFVGLIGLAGCATTPAPPQPAAAGAPTAGVVPAAQVATPPPEPPTETTAPAPQKLVRVPEAAAAAAPRAAPSTAPTTPASSATPAVSRAQFVALNDERLLDVYPGMSRRAVEQLMRVEHDGQPWNPFKRESLQRPGGQRYDVVFYLTREPARGKPITEAQLTPVIFQGDTVYAVGRHPLKKLRKTVCEGRCS